MEISYIHLVKKLNKNTENLDLISVVYYPWLCHIATYSEIYTVMYSIKPQSAVISLLHNTVQIQIYQSYIKPLIYIVCLSICTR